MRAHLRLALVGLLFTLAGIGAGVALGAGEPGDVDDTFNGGNPQFVARGTDTTASEFNDVIVDGFGRIIAAGGYGDTFPTSIVARMQPNGTLDPSFGTGGVVERDYVEGGEYRGIFRDPAGRLGLAGAVDFQYRQTFVSARLTDAGGTDDTYGTDGVATSVTRPPAQTSNYYNAARALLGDDGSTFLAGYTTTDQFGTSPKITVAKMTPAGAPATYGTFGNGVAQVSLGPSSTEFVYDAAPGPSGTVLLVGATDVQGGSRRMFLARLAANGALDPTFGGGDGWVSIDPSTGGNPSRANAVAVAPDGSIYLGGTAQAGNQTQNMAIAKFTSAGVGVPTFGSGGFARVTSTQAGYADLPLPGTALAVGNDNKPVLVGSVELAPWNNGGRRELVLARFTTSGQPDASFHADGIATSRIVMPATGVGAMERPLPLRAKATGDGKLLVAGRGGEPGLSRYAFVARFVLIRQEDLKYPRTIEAPRLTGVPSPGSVLTCNPGAYTNNPTSITRVFERAPRDTASDESPAWLPIAGTTGTTYTVQPTDLGARLRCRETASNAEGSSTAVTRSFRVDAGVPVNTTPPGVDGEAIVGRTLTCLVGSWDNAGDYDVRWTFDGGYTLQGGRTLVLRDDLRRHRVGCEVRASNDVGAAAPIRTPERLVVAAPPANLKKPTVTLAPTGARPTDNRATCNEGTWDDDYEQYTYEWLREGTAIPAQTGKTYATTVDDLGRLLTCRVVSTNPLGPSRPATGAESLVPLPSSGPAGKVFAAVGFNQYDPTNLLALSADQLGAIKSVVLKRFQDALAAKRQACGSARGVPNFGDAIGRTLTAAETCALLGEPGQPLSITMNGVFWKPTTCVSDAPIDQPAPPPTSKAAKAAGFFNILRLLSKYVGGIPICPKVGLDVKSVDPARAPALDPVIAAAIAPVAPVRVLWDMDRDGRVDNTCGPDAPINRTLLNRGNYKVRAVVIDRTSEETGQYSIAEFTLPFFAENAGQIGYLRTAQPFACRTSLDPPPEPASPCVTQGQIGRMQLRGNLCPISLRKIPQAELKDLPPGIHRMLEKQALNLPLRKRTTAPATAFQAGFRFPTAFASQAVQLNKTAATLTNAVAGFADPPQLNIPTAWQNDLKNVKGFTEQKAQFALDQIYQAKGTLKVNGVGIDPIGGASTVVIPSDVGDAVSSVKEMTIAASKAQTAIDGIPLGKPEKLLQDMPDSLKGAAPVLKTANLDQLASDLKKKLDLGPFKLAGDVKVTMLSDGTAQLDAKAELPALTTEPKSKPIRADVTIRGNTSGKLVLDKLRITAPGAYLSAVKIKDVLINYDKGGLFVQGGLLFPPVNQGIRINRFRLGPNGAFRELDVDYLAGAGQGIPIGTGTYLTRIGGGLSLDPDEIRGRATVSVGPSTGGGCPTAGIDAEFAVHFAPYPFYVDANGTVRLLCIPVANMGFRADQTGLVRINGGASLDAGPIYVRAGMNAEFRLPQWQIDVHGKGGIRKVLEAQVKAMLSNIGLAGCGRVTIAKIPNPFGDDPKITIAGGAGVRFSKGVPPLSFPQLVAALDLFTGCDLTRYSPFGRDARAAQAGGRSFTLPSREEVVSLFVTGNNGVVRGKLKSPDGKVIDLSQVRDTLGETSRESSAIAVPEKDRLVVLLGAPKGGSWTLTPDPGSPAITDLRFATKLPPPEVKAKVSGRGSTRTLTWDVKPLTGQVVRLVEKARGGERPIAVVRRGGKGSKRFTVSVAKSKARRIVAMVQQDGLPRTNLTVARFTAASPKIGRPGRVRISRTGATRAQVRWSKAALAKEYDVVVTSGDGERRLLTTKRTRVSVSGLTARTRISVRVIAIDEGGRRGRAGTARTKVARRR